MNMTLADELAKAVAGHREALAGASAERRRRARFVDTLAEHEDEKLRWRAGRAFDTCAGLLIDNADAILAALRSPDPSGEYARGFRDAANVALAIELKTGDPKCVRGHDRCESGADEDCPYCERKTPVADAILALADKEPEVEHLSEDEMNAREAVRAEREAIIELLKKNADAADHHHKWALLEALHIVRARATTG